MRYVSPPVLGLPLFIQRRNPRRQCQMGLTAGIAGALVAAAALRNGVYLY
ncbi:MAG: hypothetical protein ACLR17_06010 [Enterobacteriaceae bacterium]